MGNSPSMPKVTKRDRAILDLKLLRDKIRQYQVKIQHVLDREQEAAKACLRAGQKDRALLALRRRKYQESLLLKTDAQLENLEGLVSTIEFSLVEMSVLHGLQQGNAVLADIHKEMNIESVEKLLGETQDAIAYQKEINDMLANSMTADDEDAVQRELAQMQQAEIERHALPSTGEPAAVALPNVPQQEPNMPRPRYQSRRRKPTTDAVQRELAQMQQAEIERHALPSTGEPAAVVFPNARLLSAGIARRRVSNQVLPNVPQEEPTTELEESPATERTPVALEA